LRSIHANSKVSLEVVLRASSTKAQVNLGTRVRGVGIGGAAHATHDEALRALRMIPVPV
jgi:hypothetical protein